MEQKIANIIFNNMDWNIVILCVQAFILIWQLRLSKKINLQTMKLEIGYFLIEKTNIGRTEEEKKPFRDKFDLRKGGIIGFHATKADVIIQKSAYIVDGTIYRKKKAPDAFYTEDNRIRKLTVFLDLKESDYEKRYLDIELIFYLKNVAGYKYIETVYVQFSKIENSNFWEISKYNMSVDKRGQRIALLINKMKNLVG